MDTFEKKIHTDAFKKGISYCIERIQDEITKEYYRKQKLKKNKK